MNSTNPIFCAMDTQDLSYVLNLSKKLMPHIGGIKLGLEFFTSNGANGVRDVAALGLPIFLDLKFHDIPNTVAKAVKAAVALNISMLTIHTLGGSEMMRAAANTATEEAAKHNKKAPLILGVTVLTSMDDSAIHEIGIHHNAHMQVMQLAALAEKSGLGGLVCSAHEIAALRQNYPKLKLIVPGIRPAGSEAGDQKRVMTPKDAVNLGADYLVIGRPIIDAADPVAAAKTITASLYG